MDEIEKDINHLFDSEIDDDNIEERLNEYLPLIGELVITFNSLEELVDYLLVERISEHDKEMGFIIISGKNFSTKVDLLKNVYNRIINGCSLKKTKQKIDALFIDIKNAGVERNGIIHGSWLELSNESYVKIKTIVKKDGVKHKYKKIKPEKIKKSIYSFNQIVEDLETFDEEINEEINNC